jgi:hypothetical protein
LKIGLITTLDTNIGDDFIREGISNVLRKLFKKDNVHFFPVNKHLPLTVYPRWHPARLSDIPFPFFREQTRGLIEKYTSQLGHSCFDNCDLIVQCGAPVFWPNCHANEWAVPLWDHVIGRICDKIPVLNLAAGSCYPWERQPSTIDNSSDAQYMGRILGYCKLTTVRDRLAQIICKYFGIDVSLIACSAFLAAGDEVAKVSTNGYILINYMTGGGHYDWEQHIDAGIWQQSVNELVSRLRRRHKVAFLCHDAKELLSARQLFSDLPAFLPKTTSEYFNLAGTAKFGICNRMHASVGMAALGIPSIAVCTDTRLLMVETLGLPCFYVKDANADNLEHNTELLLSRQSNEQERIIALRSETLFEYNDVINKAINA